MVGWQPCKKYCVWLVVSLWNRVLHTLFTILVISFPKWQRLAASLAHAGAKWESQSVAQLASLKPETNMVRKHRDRAARLPDLYAKNNATQCPLAILNRQMGALRTYCKKYGPGNLPLYGGLKFLTIENFDKTGGPHED